MRLLTLRFIPLVIGSLLLMTYSVFSAAAKPMRDGVFLGNGFPSGPHYNLIIHGKDRNTFTCPAEEMKDVTLWIHDGIAEIYSAPKDQPDLSCDQFLENNQLGGICQLDQIYGNSIFVPRTEVGDEIQVILESGSKGPRSRKDSGYVLKALEATDWCTEPFDADAAVVRFPQDPKGYAVYGRVLGKPARDAGEPSFTFIAEGLTQVLDENDNDLLLLGLVTKDGVFVPDPDGLGGINGEIKLIRWDSTSSGKGAKKATELTGLFEYSGEVCYLTADSQNTYCPTGDPDCAEGAPLCCINVDSTVDGTIDQCIGSTDLLGDYTTWYEANSDAVASFEAGKDQFCADPNAISYAASTAFSSYSWIVPQCKQFIDEWVFNISDFVDVLWGGDTTGAYNVQVRFYPISENPQLEPQ